MTFVRYSLSRVLLFSLLAATLTTIACAPERRLPHVDESGLETGYVVSGLTTVGTGMGNPLEQAKEAGATIGSGGSGKETATGKAGSAAASEDRLRISVSQSTNVRFKKDDVLEFKYELPPGSVIEVAKHYVSNAARYRDSDGQVSSSTTGFVSPVKVISLGGKSQLSPAKLAELNNTPGGLYVIATIVAGQPKSEGTFHVLTPKMPGSAYGELFHSSGQPRFSFSNGLKKKFGSKLNHAGETAPAGGKSHKLMAELQRAADRESASAKKLLIIPRADAKKRAERFENEGTISTEGAWTMAVVVTASKHGFSNTPCAEFVSEVIRQAYKRAGLKITDDFNGSRGNRLIWSQTASVKGLRIALVKAGWIPWDAHVYRIPTGAVVMNETGGTPGHVYVAAGLDGRFVIDNGSPQGRDLGQTKKHTLGMMYRSGVFFLPPGLKPIAWGDDTAQVTVAEN